MIDQQVYRYLTLVPVEQLFRELNQISFAGPSMRVHIDVHIECVSSPYSGTVVGDTPSVKVEWVWLIDGTVCGTGTIYSTAGTGYIWI